MTQPINQAASALADMQEVFTAQQEEIARLRSHLRFQREVEALPDLLRATITYEPANRQWVLPAWSLGALAYADAAILLKVLPTK